MSNDINELPELLARVDSIIHCNLGKQIKPIFKVTTIEADMLDGLVPTYWVKASVRGQTPGQLFAQWLEVDVDLTDWEEAKARIAEMVRDADKLANAVTGRPIATDSRDSIDTEDDDGASDFALVHGNCDGDEPEWSLHTTGVWACTNCKRTRTWEDHRILGRPGWFTDYDGQRLTVKTGDFGMGNVSMSQECSPDLALDAERDILAVMDGWPNHSHRMSVSPGGLVQDQIVEPLEATMSPGAQLMVNELLGNDKPEQEPQPNALRCMACGHTWYLNVPECWLCGGKELEPVVAEPFNPCHWCHGNLDADGHKDNCTSAALEDFRRAWNQEMKLLSNRMASAWHRATSRIGRKAKERAEAVINATRKAINDSGDCFICGADLGTEHHKDGCAIAVMDGVPMEPADGNEVDDG